jgi:hypothetical protein
LPAPSALVATTWADVKKRLKENPGKWAGKENLYWIHSTETPIHSPGLWLFVEVRQSSAAEKAMTKKVDKQFVVLPQRSDKELTMDGQGPGYLYYVRIVGKVNDVDMAAIVKAIYVALAANYSNPTEFWAIKKANPSYAITLKDKDWSVDFDTNVKVNLDDTGTPVKTRIQGLKEARNEWPLTKFSDVEPALTDMFKSSAAYIGSDISDISEAIEGDSNGKEEADLIRLDERDWS